MTTAKKRPVVVCTDKDKRGVFFGWVTGPTKGKDDLVLTDCQMVVYWSFDVQGVLGLAATGPTEDCRISKSIPKFEVRGVTCVMDCTEMAVLAWEKQPWAS